jgi:hypothetical protein
MAQWINQWNIDNKMRTIIFPCLIARIYVSAIQIVWPPDEVKFSLYVIRAGPSGTGQRYQII